MNNKLKVLRTANNNQEQCEPNARQFYVNTGHIRQRQALYNGCDNHVDGLYGINVATFNTCEGPRSSPRGSPSAGINSLARFHPPSSDVRLCKPVCLPDCPPEAPGYPLDPSYHLLSCCNLQEDGEPAESYIKYPSPSPDLPPSVRPPSLRPSSVRPSSIRPSSIRPPPSPVRSPSRTPSPVYYPTPTASSIEGNGNKLSSKGSSVEDNANRAPTSSRVSSKTEATEDTEPETEPESEEISDEPPKSGKEVEIVEACPESCFSGKVSVCMVSIIRWIIFIVGMVLVFIGLLLFMCHNCTSHKAIVLIDTLLLFIKVADIMCYHL